MLVARIGDYTLHLRSPAEVQEALLALYRIDVRLLQELPEGTYPRLYDSGVRWQLERDPRRSGGETWLTLEELYDGRETADCEDIASAYAAELTVLDGVPAVPRVTFVPGGFHIVVQTAAGHIFDPSLMLGMDRPIDLGRVDSSEAGARKGLRALRGIGKGLWRGASSIPVVGDYVDAVDSIGRGLVDDLAPQPPDLIIDAEGRPMYPTDDEPDDERDGTRAREVGALW